MRISKFKPGDLIVRVGPNKNGDHSYSATSTCFELVGSSETGIYLVEISLYGRTAKSQVLDPQYWDDSNWEYAPTDAMNETMKRIRLITEAMMFDDETRKLGDLKPGQLVITSDKRYGFIKAIDWHAVKFIGRGDYQVQFPDGVGIFRRDELEPAKEPTGENRDAE